MDDRFASAADAAMKRVQREIEAQMFGVSTATAFNDQPPLTVETVLATIHAMPPRETWVVSRMFAPNVATTIKAPGENFTCLNDGTWLRFQYEIQRQTPIEHRGNPLYEIRPVFLDECEGPYWTKEHDRILTVIAGTMSAAVQLGTVMKAWWHRLPPA